MSLLSSYNKLKINLNYLAIKDFKYNISTLKVKKLFKKKWNNNFTYFIAHGIGTY